MQYDINAGNENKKRKYIVKTIEDIRKSDEQEMLKLLRTKKGVCWHFGNLFTRLCAVQGIDVEMISGTRRAKVLPDTLALNHLWNAVEIDGEMKMIDCTISYKLPYKKADFDQFFLVDPEVFIYSSIPLDTDKQYLEKPISYESFKKLVWPQPMFNLLQVKDLIPRHKRIVPRRDGIAQFNFKIDNQIQIDSLEVYVNNRFIKSIPANKASISISLPVTSLSWISIQAVKIKNGFKQNWYLLDYDVL
jgi:transglutaminase/protease-like cytokinesis protein 3